MDDPVQEARKKLAEDMSVELTERQLHALSDLFHGSMQVSEVAAAAGVTRATLWEWQSLPAWKKEWELRRSLVLLQQRSRLVSLTHVAMDRLEALAKGKPRNHIVRRDGTLSPDKAPVPYDVQLRACEAIIKVAESARDAEIAESPVQVVRQTPLKSELLGMLQALPDGPPVFQQAEVDASTPDGA